MLFAPPFPSESGRDGGALLGVFFSMTLTTFARVGVGVLAADASGGGALGLDLPEPIPAPRREGSALPLATSPAAAGLAVTSKNKKKTGKKDDVPDRQTSRTLTLRALLLCCENRLVASGRTDDEQGNGRVDGADEDGVAEQELEGLRCPSSASTYRMSCPCRGAAPAARRTRATTLAASSRSGTRKKATRCSSRPS